MKTQTSYPKKAKLITDGGYYKIIPLPAFMPKINMPMRKKVQIGTPETNVLDCTFTMDIQFYYTHTEGKRYCVYKQYNVVSLVK